LAGLGSVEFRDPPVQAVLPPALREILQTEIGHAWVTPEDSGLGSNLHEEEEPMRNREMLKVQTCSFRTILQVINIAEDFVHMPHGLLKCVLVTPIGILKRP
jgi:hypothetical protein